MDLADVPKQRSPIFRVVATLLLPAWVIALGLTMFASISLGTHMASYWTVEQKASVERGETISALLFSLWYLSWFVAKLRKEPK